MPWWATLLSFYEPTAVEWEIIESLLQPIFLHLKKITGVVVKK